MIYTGYYAKLNKYEEAGLIPVAISGTIPEFYTNRLRYSDFAPRYSFFKAWRAGEIDNFEYTIMYKDYLDTLDKKEIKEDFDSPHKCSNMILLCYEKTGDFCHRHILADWLEENFGYRVEEYEV